jgi:hypothetical protein
VLHLRVIARGQRVDVFEADVADTAADGVVGGRPRLAAPRRADRAGCQRLLLALSGCATLFTQRRLARRRAAR